MDWEADPTWLEKYHQSEQAPKRFRDEIKNEMEKTLSNAIIMPYTTTQLAQQLIESYQKDFKIGWLFSSKKTEEERQKRLQELYQDLSEKVTSQIEWHLKELVRKKSEVFQLDAQEYLTSIMEWSLQIPREWLVQEIKTDIVSREYVYHYTNEVAKKVHQLYRNKIESLIEEGSALLQERHQIMYSSAQESLAKWGQLEQLEQKEKGIEEKVEQQIAVYRDELVSHLPHGSKQLHFEITELRMNESQKDEESKKTQEQTQSNRDQHLKLNSEGLLRVARQLEHAATLLADIPSFHPLVQDFREKAERLKNNRFTVCLFGAFSAGKSSFANALMGQGVLPVSPNPTTAAINQVLPATAENPAGTAMIKMKSRHQVEEEIRISLQRLLLPIQHSEQESLQQIEKLKPHELRPSLKPYYSFLLACHKGWEEAQAIIGTQFKVDKAEFAQFVAVEQKACFVESIQLFHDSYLAQNGVELIDTPGADSIYSRHTNVTFNYIKNADVILYVTYYNHAFSKADRDFLDQLGRVKDQFALDKMFFMVNASDLAASEEELHDVVQHVEQNLLQSGIRFPRIYPVSSIRALEGEAHSGMEEFEAAFFSFLQDDLAQILVESAERDIEKAYVLLDEMRKELLTSTEVREAKIDDLNRKEQEWQEQIQNEKYPSVANELEKEVQELLYYVKQRVFFNFQRHLNDSFHPSVLSQERTGKKELQQCLEELLFSLLHQIKDECKATSLRLEKMLDRILDRMIVEWQRKTENEKMVLKGAHIHRPSFEVPLLPENFMSIPTKELEGSFAHFKNPKYFFEQGGKALLRTELEKRLQVTVDSYLEAVQELFIAFYLKAWQQVEAAMKQGLSEEIKMAVESKRFALRGEISVAQLDQMMKAYQDSIVGDVER
ncbi:dynamin family protein [Caldalkalibacillus mannanilyticus]|uniref:dynamin family protein n=1 Tax=Caldalkalibacillus mannanilyticus TaxID=1418 RepID=UPI0004695359|nr:dynamin family protein [Caldalkalibacillus mannanilyticus]